LLAEIIEAQKTDVLATELLDKRGRDHVTKQVTKQHVTGHVTEEETTTEDWAVSAAVLTYEGRVYVPEGLRSKVTALHHDNPESGHFGALKTAELVSRNFYWPALQTSVRQYVAGCEVCHRIKAARHAKYGVNMPIEPPSQLWEGVSNGFRHRFTRIDSLGLHGHLGNCGSIDEDGDLSTVPQGRQLAKASEDVLRRSYLQARCPKQYRHRSRISIHKLILEPRVLTPEH
jgi:hypothetical protein